MRALLLAFVAGCWLLQQQGALPAGRDWLLGACAVAMLACTLAWVAVRAAATPRRPWVRHARLAAGIVVALAVGFGWAAWRADLRLDRWLDPGMAGRDVVVDGIVAGCPMWRPTARASCFTPRDGRTMWCTMLRLRAAVQCRRGCN